RHTRWPRDWSSDVCSSDLDDRPAAHHGNLALIRTIADEVAVMSGGTIVELGKVDDVLDAPQNPYTKALLADTPSMETALAAAGRSEERRVGKGGGDGRAHG